MQQENLSNSTAKSIPLLVFKEKIPIFRFALKVYQKHFSQFELLHSSPNQLIFIKIEEVKDRRREEREIKIQRKKNLQSIKWRGEDETVN